VAELVELHWCNWGYSQAMKVEFFPLPWCIREQNLAQSWLSVWIICQVLWR